MESKKINIFGRFNISEINIKILVFLSFCAWLLFSYVQYYINLIHMGPFYFDLYGFVYFFVDYSKGLVPRGLLGELMNGLILSNNADIMSFFVILKVRFVLLMVCILILALYNIMLKCDLNVFLLVCMLFVRPSYILSVFYILRHDNVWYLFLPLMLLILWRVKNRYVQLCLLIFCSTVCMLCHQAFVFAFAPLICSFLLVYKSYKSFLIYGFSIALEFVIINFGFRSCTYTDILNMVCDKISNTCIASVYITDSWQSVAKMALYDEYGSSHATQVFTDSLLQHNYLFSLYRLGFIVIFSFFSIFILFKVLKAYLRQDKRNWFVIAVFLIPFACLLCFTIDCDRWFLMLLSELDIFAGWLICTKKLDIGVTKYTGLMYVLSILVNCFYFVWGCPR